MTPDYNKINSNEHDSATSVLQNLLFTSEKSSEQRDPLNLGDFAQIVFLML